MDLSDKKILITGASGALGKQLIYEFDKMGIRPIAHVRETSDTTYIDSLGLEKRIGDLRQKENLSLLVEGIDLVILAAAWVNFRQGQPSQFAGINIFGAVDVFNAAKRAGVRRFLHVSTVAAVAAIHRKQTVRRTRDDFLVREETEFNLGHLQIPYILTKHAAEQQLREAAGDGSTELVIVNPSIIVTPSRTGNDRLKAAGLFNRFIMPNFPVRVNLVDIRDVVPGIIAALKCGRSGERYILGGENITVRDLVLSASAVLDKMPHVMRIPRPLLNFAARASVIGSRLLGRRKVSFYPDLVKTLDYDWAYSSRKAREELGYRYRSIHTTLEDLLTNSFTGTYLKPSNSV
ncbi:MAG: SDR family oxidoreductase [Candidatus Zixiibacteriota bacterium]|nr:MAG: SDR family oxidoreductase [candidate division Zixibacteria bacterium]